MIDEFIDQLDHYIDLKISAQLKITSEQDVSDAKWALRQLLLCLINGVKLDGASIKPILETRAEQLVKLNAQEKRRYGLERTMSQVEWAGPIQDCRGGSHKR